MSNSYLEREKVEALEELKTIAVRRKKLLVDLLISLSIVPLGVVVVSTILLVNHIRPVDRLWLFLPVLLFPVFRIFFTLLDLTAIALKKSELRGRLSSGKGGS